MKNVIVVCYFVHSKYNKYELFSEWYSNVKKHYLVNTNRKFIIITDNKIIKDKNKDSNVEIRLYHDDFHDINENRLKKFTFLSEILMSETIENTDYIAFLQSNFRLNKDVLLEELIGQKNISVVYHPEFQKTRLFSRYYHQERVKNVDRSITDISNINVSKFNYFYSGIFVMEIQYAKRIISWIYNAINTDKFNGVQILGQPYDERYFNYFLNVIDNDISNVNILDSNIYASRNKNSPGCKIYQIDKSKSVLFK